MRCPISVVFLAACFVPVGLETEAKAQEAPYNVPSKYGKFKVDYNSKTDTCKVSFSSTIGEQKTTTLFTTECLSAYDSPGISSPGLEEKVGTVAFPYLASNGDEFHFFSIAAALGGSACYGFIYWTVVINGDKIWATKDSFSDCMETVTSAKATNKRGKTTISFSSDAGVSYNVSMGRLETITPKKTKKKARDVKSTTTLLITGNLFPDGFGYTGYLPIIQSPTNENDILIDQVGTCALNDYEMDTPVRMTVELKVWSDGIEERTCLSVQKK